MRCSACGAANPDESRFCGACASHLAAPPLRRAGSDAPARPLDIDHYPRGR
jgi:zinc-ribbon domain